MNNYGSINFETRKRNIRLSTLREGRKDALSKAFNARKKRTYKAGDRWGSVKVLSVERKGWVRGDEVLDTKGGPQVLTLQCRCSRVFTVDSDTYNLMIKVRACGEPECVHTQDEAELLKRRLCVESQAITVYAPVRLQNTIERYRAINPGMTKGQALMDLVDYGEEFLEQRNALEAVRAHPNVWGDVEIGVPACEPATGSKRGLP